MIVAAQIMDACDGGATVTVTFEDETGVVHAVAWNVQAGVLTISDPPVVADRRRLDRVVKGVRDRAQGGLGG